jgi:F-type H+-transporting ATPase subunit alpha
MDVIDQVIQIFAGTRGILDDLPVTQVHPFARALLEYFQSTGAALRAELLKNQSFKGGLEDRFKQAMGDFKTSWMQSNLQTQPAAAGA